MAISRVWIVEGCISCGACETIAPDVFEVEDVAVVKDGADIQENEELVREAADACPVAVIKFE